MHRLALLAVPLLLAGSLSSCGGDQGQETATGSPTANPATGRSSCEYLTDAQAGAAAKDVEPPPSEPEPASRLTLTTNRGDIPVALDADRAPCTVNAFTSLARQGFFDDTSCHRLTTAGIFVLQCGDPTGTGTGGPGYRFGNEITGNETYPAGTVAMAHSALPDSNGSQFFIVYDDTELPADYTVFGHVDRKGLQVVRDIAAKGTADGSTDGAPKEDVVIESVE